MSSVAEMREAVEQLAVIDPAPPEIQRERINTSGADAEWIIVIRNRFHKI